MRTLGWDGWGIVMGGGWVGSWGGMGCAVVWVAEYSRTAWMKEKKGYTLVDVQCTIVQKYMLYRSPHEVKGEVRGKGEKIDIKNKLFCSLFACFPLYSAITV